MRWHTRHLSGHVPGPTSVMNGAGAILTVIAVVVLGVLTLIKFLMIALGFVLKTVPKVIAWLVIVVTAPLWGPIRGLHRHRVRKGDRKAIARVQRLNATRLTQPPSGQRVAP